VSPTLGESLKACRLQVAYRLDDRFVGYRRGSTAAALGIASHELLELASHGAFRGLSGAELKEALERRWDELVARQVEALSEAWPFGQIPDPTRWPGYELTHTRLISSLSAELSHASPPTESGGRARVEAELWLEDDAKVIGGRVDRVEHTPQGTRIIDLKSGWTVRELTDAQRRQLLIYAYLWHEHAQEWPVEAAIQHPDGTRLAVEVTPEAALAAVEELRANREAFNDAARRGIEPSELASPENETCARCAFKATCPYFFGQASAEWEWYRPSVLLRVGAVRSSGEATVWDGKVLATTSSRTPQVGEAVLVVIPADVRADVDGVVAVADARRPGHGPSLTTSWDSTLSLWGSDPIHEFAASAHATDVSARRSSESR
jgi:hypothetical protein